VFGVFSPRLSKKKAGHVRPIINANYTVSPIDELVLVDATSAPLTIALPPALSLIGYSFKIMKIDSSANNVTIDANGSETISGALTIVLDQQWLEADVFSIGTGWVVL
jgi:hypothetical protein